MTDISRKTFEELIEADGRLVYTNVGDSMMPLIKQGRDLIVIEKLSGRPRKYDVVLYKRDSGKYVLHRIIKVRKDDYVICGDNRSSREYGITDRHIIGVLTSVIRDGREVRVTDPGYKLYVHLWCDLFPLRAAIIKLRELIRKLKRRRRNIK